MSLESRKKMNIAHKSCVPWNKGKKGLQICSIETKLKMSKLHKGQRAWNKGKNQSEETRQKISNALKGRKFSNEHKMKMSTWQIGRKLPIETRLKISEARKGEKNLNWKGGITPLYYQIRKLLQSSIWRTAVFERDNYTCQECGVMGKRLQADHIKQFALIILENNIKTIDQALACKELWDINNGRTLCKECHKSLPTNGRHIKTYQKEGGFLYA